MRNILKIADTTTVQFVRQGTFHYVEQVSEDANLRFGNAISSYLTAEAFYMTGGLITEVNVGDEIYYYREYDVDNEFNPITPPVQELIGIFTVTRCEKSKKTYTFYAYDNISKLNVDYSYRLAELKTNSAFPMALPDFLDDIETFMANLGVTVNVSTLRSHSASSSSISYFYSQGITVANILCNFAELESCYLKCRPTGEIDFTSFTTTASYQTNYWHNSDRYIIAPSDQVTYTGTAVINGQSQTVTLFPVFYKQDGLTKEDYFIAPFKHFSIYNMNRSKGYGKFWTKLPTTPQVYGTYLVTNNMVYEYTAFGGSDILSIASGINAFHDILNTVITPFTVRLFPFRNPFGAGSILPHITDINDTRFKSLVMKMEWTDSEVILSCANSEIYHDDQFKNYGTDDITQTLSTKVNTLEETINGKVSKSGDTMTGELVVQDAPVSVQDTVYSRSDLPSSTQYRYVQFLDKARNILGAIRSVLTSAGRSGVYVYGTNGNTNNAVGLYVDPDGTPSVTLSAPSAWLEQLGLGTSGALPVTVAQGGTGATTTEGVKNAFDPFRNATSITSNASLNDFYVQGVYYSGSSAITNSLSNCPVSGSGFTMLVMMLDTASSASSRRVQVIFAGQDIYVRRRDTSAWTSWYRFTGTAV